MDQPELTQQALAILRSGENFQWYVITLLALVMYVYTNEISKKNWKGIAAGLSLYATHWFFEIINALIQKFSGHALWTVPTGTSWLLLVGVGIELSLMFSIAGLVLSQTATRRPQSEDPGHQQPHLLCHPQCRAVLGDRDLFGEDTRLSTGSTPGGVLCRCSSWSTSPSSLSRSCVMTGNPKPSAW